jgi:poly(A) polymerase
MQEDPVRALRAIHFASRLGFTIEPETFAAMRRHAPELARCAAPRLLEETFKILRCGASTRAFELLRTSGALPLLLPALAAFYDAAPDEGRRRFVAHLAALDRLVKAGGEPSEAVLLGALLLHLPAGEPGGPSDRDRMLTELMATARLPRKIAERTRLALMSQRALRGPAKRRRRGLAAQTYFTDALQLLELTVQATGEGASVLERWRGEEAAGGSAESAPEGGLSLERSAPPGSDETELPGEVPVEAAKGAGSGRSRRGGRRRRRRGGGSSGAPRAARPPQP